MTCPLCRFRFGIEAIVLVLWRELKMGPWLPHAAGFTISRSLPPSPPVFAILLSYNFDITIYSKIRFSLVCWGSSRLCQNLGTISYLSILPVRTRTEIRAARLWDTAGINSVLSPSIRLVELQTTAGWGETSTLMDLATSMGCSKQFTLNASD